MAQYAKYGRRPGAAVGARAAVWIIISIVFLVLDFMKLARLHAAGLHPTWYFWVQIAVWTAVLLFWSYSGLRAVRKGKVS